MLHVPGSPVSLSGKLITTLVTAGTPSLTVWGTTQTSGAGVDTLTAAFTDLVTAANMIFDVGYVELWIAANAVPAAANTSTLLNLYTGAAASEVTLVSGLPIGL